MNYIIPTVSTVGTYTLSAPFNQYIDPNINYTCSAVRTINEMIADGFDPYDNIYKVAGLSQTQYNNDVAASMMIVKLVSSAGQIIYTPASYITAYPNITGIQYHILALNAILPPIQVGKDLSAVITDLGQFFTDTLGVSANITQVEISEIYSISETDSAAIENARTAIIAESGTYFQLYTQQNNINAKLVQQLNALQDYVITINSKMSELKQYATTTNDTSLQAYLNSLGF